MRMEQRQSSKIPHWKRLSSAHHILAHDPFANFADPKLTAEVSAIHNHPFGGVTTKNLSEIPFLSKMQCHSVEPSSKPVLCSCAHTYQYSAHTVPAPWCGTAQRPPPRAHGSTADQVTSSPATIVAICPGPLATDTFHELLQFSM